MQIDIRRPNKLYRYSERKWLEKSLLHGEFRLRPASHYQSVETDHARNDDELRRVLTIPRDSVTITNVTTGTPIVPTSDITMESAIETDYLTLCMARQWGTHFFDDFTGSDACLLIHDTEQFCERIHAAADLALPGWAGVDGPVSYGSKSPLGVAFTKHDRFVFQVEWRFAWVPMVPPKSIEPVIISIGNMEDIGEIVSRP